MRSSRFGPRLATMYFIAAVCCGSGLPVFLDSAMFSDIRSGNQLL